MNAPTISPTGMLDNGVVAGSPNRPHMVSPPAALHESGHDRGSEPPEQAPKLPRKLPRDACLMCGDSLQGCRGKVICHKRSCRAARMRQVARARWGETKVCRLCRTRKSLSVFPPVAWGEGTGHRCRDCLAKRARGYRSRGGKPCQGEGCTNRTQRNRLCGNCREAKQRKLEALLTQAPLAPTICGLPIRGGRCLHAVTDQVDRQGRGVLWCVVHGERLAPVIRPKNFVRYDQAERHAKALAQSVVRAKSMPSPEASAHGRAARAGQQNFVVVGRTLSDRIHAA